MTNPFDRRPDPELGRLLKSHLDRPGTGEFVARVMAGLPPRGQRDSLEVLAAWTRPWLAAAAIIVAALGVWLARPAAAGAVSEPLLELGRAGDRELIATAMIREP